MKHQRISKDTILAIAEKFFANRKYHEVLMDDIAKELQIAKGSLYNYFSSKEELYVQIVINRFEKFLSTLQEKIRQDCNPSENLKILVIQFYSFMCKYSHFFEIWKQLKTHAYRLNHDQLMEYQQTIYTMFTHIIEAGIKKHQFREDVDEFMIEMIIGMLEKAIERGILLSAGDRAIERERITEIISRLVEVDHPLHQYSLSSVGPLKKES